MVSAPFLPYFLKFGQQKIPASTVKISTSGISLTDPDGNRTRVTAVKGRCLNRLTTGPKWIQ